MKVNQIQTPEIKKIVKVALDNNYKVTIAQTGTFIDSGAGTPFRFRKGRMMGWDILYSLAIKSNVPSSGLNFSVFEDSVIIYDPKGI